MSRLERPRPMKPITSRSRSVSASGPVSRRGPGSRLSPREMRSKITGATDGRHDALARGEVAHRARELVGLEAPVDEVAVGPGADRPGDHRLVVGVGEHHDLALARQALGGLDAVHDRHADVEQHHVGVQQLGLLDRLAAGRGLAHDLDVVGRRRQQRAHPLADDRVVVGDQDPDHSDRLLERPRLGGADVAGRQAHGDRRARRRGRPAISHRRADALAALGHARSGRSGRWSAASARRRRRRCRRRRRPRTGPRRAPRRAAAPRTCVAPAWRSTFSSASRTMQKSS